MWYEFKLNNTRLYDIMYMQILCDSIIDKHQHMHFFTFKTVLF